MTDNPKFVYVTYIAAPPQRVWDALTKPEISETYWFGYRVAADGKPGDYMTATNPAGNLSHRDPISPWRRISPMNAPRA
jgi:uncharacterized protein YndB with AHSA1/START domain